MKKSFLLFCFFCFFSIFLCKGEEYGLIRVSVADLRGKPAAMNHPVGFWHDSEQLTQLLYWERVKILSSAPHDWLYVEAPRQAMVYNNTWSPYRGYIQRDQVQLVDEWPNKPNAAVSQTQYTPIYDKSCQHTGCLPSNEIVSVSFGTLLHVVEEKYGWCAVLLASPQKIGYTLCSALSSIDHLPNDEKALRATIVQRTNLLLGWLYFWGGRSSFSQMLYESGQQLSGLDCSGLTGIAYQSVGLEIPRDASKQALAVNNVTSPNALKEGDLFFYSNSAGHVFHVMMLYSTQHPPTLVESSTNSTRIRSIQESFGVPLDQLQYGMVLPSNGNVLTYGSLFPWHPSKWAYGQSV